MGLIEWVVTKIAVKKTKESAMGKFLEGKKTYIVLGLTILFGALDAYNEYCGGAGCKTFQVPSIVFSILGGLGLWTRAVAKK